MKVRISVCTFFILILDRVCWLL